QARTRNFRNETGKRLARERDAVDLAGVHAGDRRVDAGDGNEGRSRCRALRRPERCGIGDAADANARCIRVLDFRELRKALSKSTNFLRSSSTGMKVTSHVPLAAEFWISPDARCGRDSTGTPSFRANAAPRSTVRPRNLPLVLSLTA
ncbi:MAG TPA: hypothetical protein VFN63_15745, partial [Pseudolabrys sp.]|nr:hypothetical protein [Pseudolabrys sp.]